MYKLKAPGWFDEVNGIAVVRHDLGAVAGFMSHAGHFTAHHGIEWHRQDGPGDDIFDTQIARGFPIATWSVDDEGLVHQYNHMFEFADWHGDSVSEYAFGIEHGGFFGTPCTPKQLDSSAALCAAIVEITADVFGETIPLVKVPRISLANYRTARGFWDHDDVDAGPLNEHNHVDKLEGRSWADQLRKIGSFLVDPTPPPQFHKILLSRGVDAADVITWKRRMTVKGLFDIRDNSNGPHYGPAIERSTREFQTKKALLVDGIVGPKTWAAAWGG